MSGALTEQQLVAQLGKLQHWLLTEIDDVRAIYREFKCDDFIQAMEVARRIGELAEEHNHHPQLTVKWGSCTVYWWTHDVQGISQLDLELASLCDQI